MRKKVKFAFIPNHAQRKKSYEKRRNNLLKKLDELTTLCGIEGCAIVYSEFDPKLGLWPSPREALRLVTKFRNVPQMARGRYMLNQESFLEKTILKSQKILANARKDNRKKEISLLMYQSLNDANVLNNLGLADLNDLKCLIDQNLKEIISRKSTSTTQSQAQVASTIVDETIRQGHAQVDCDQFLDMVVDFINGGENEMLPT